jgi:hypothetical protein
MYIQIEGFTYKEVQAGDIFKFNRRKSNGEEDFELRQQKRQLTLHRSP